MSNLKMLLILSRSSFILILMMFHLVASVPVKSRKRSPNESDQGFSASPKILEIQLPLKIASKEDLIAWSKYVMRLVASKINLTASMAEKRGSLADNSVSKSKETIKKAPLNEKRPGVNYPARRLKEPRRPDDVVVAYPLPIGGMKSAMSKQDSFGLPTSNTANGLTDFAQFANFGYPFQQSEIDFFGNPDLLAQPPASTYLPLPLKTNNIGAYDNPADKNSSGLPQEPVKLQTTKQKSFNLHIKTLNNDLAQLPIIVNNGLTEKNVSREPLLTFPFQALITITRQQLPAAVTITKTQPKDRLAMRTRNPPDEFPPYFEKNYTLTNKAGQINVVLNNDFAANTSSEKIEPKEEEKEEEEEEQNVRAQKKKKSEKKTKNAKTQKSSKKRRQSSVLGDLLRMLGILRKAPKNSTEINVAPPVLSILKGTNTQKIQVAFEEELPPNRDRRNETFQAQEELNDDDDDDDDEKEEEEEEEEEEEGGSIQAIIDLLPLAAPILEELSDPEADIDVGEVLRGAIPLLEDLSNPDEGGIDIPGVLVPLSQRLSEGPEGQGSDSGAILGPLIQLIAPLIGPLVGPLIGPLSRTSSGPGGKEGSASAIAAVSGPLSEPQGSYGQSIFSNLVASITAKLSKELAKSAGDSDVKALVSSLVQGVLAGASAGSSGPKGYGPNKGYGNGNRDTYYAPTTYGGYDSYSSYGTYKPSIPSANDVILASVKEILGAVLKLSATSSTSSAGLSGTSSSSSANLSAKSSESSAKEDERPTYGAPTNPPYPPPSSPPPSRPSYSPPSYSPPSTNSPYATFLRRQTRHQKKKS